MSDQAKGLPATRAVELPQPGQRWRHRNTKGVHVVAEAADMRLPGSGEWREAVAYRAVGGGKLKARCLKSWLDTFDRLVPTDTRWEEVAGQGWTRDFHGVRLWASHEPPPVGWRWQADEIGGDDAHMLEQGKDACPGLAAAQQAAEAWAAKRAEGGAR